MLYDNGILSTLKAQSKPLTLKEAISQWGNDPLWHKLVKDGCVQCYAHAVTVTSIAETWLKERDMHHWALQQKLASAESEAAYKEIHDIAQKSVFPDIAYDALTNISCMSWRQRRGDQSRSQRDEDVARIAIFLPESHKSWAGFIYDSNPVESGKILEEILEEINEESDFWDDDLVVAYDYDCDEVE